MEGPQYCCGTGQNVELPEQAAVGEAPEKGPFRQEIQKRACGQGKIGRRRRDPDLSAKIPNSAVEIEPVFADSQEGLAIPPSFRGPCNGGRCQASLSPMPKLPSAHQ